MHFLPALIPLRSVCVSTFSGFKEIPIVKTMFPECLVRSFEASPGTLRREVSKIFFFSYGGLNQDKSFINIRLPKSPLHKLYEFMHVHYILII